MNPIGTASTVTAAALEYRRLRKPSVVIDVTGNCDLKCEHCRNVDLLGSQLGYEEIAFLIERIPGPARVHFLGGEPTLHPALPEIVEFARGKGHYTSMVTNGVGLSRFGVDRLLSTGIDEVGFSLDGPGPVHDSIRGRGSFERTWDALQATSHRIAERGLATRTLVSVTAIEINLPHLPRLVECLGGSGVFVDTFVLALGFKTGRAKQPGRLGEEKKAPATADQWIDVVAEICGVWKGHPRLQHLSLRAPPRVYEYFTHAFGVYLLDSAVGCPALDPPFGGRVRSDGKFYSCGRDFIVEQAKEQGHFPLEGRHYREILDAGVELFRQTGFREILKDHTRHPRAPICDSCRWRESCIQCPLLSLMGQEKTHLLCEAVLARAPGFEGPREPLTAPRDGLAWLDEDQPILLRPDVYYREARDGTITFLSVDLDRVLTFPPELHSHLVYAAARAGQPLGAARSAYRERSGAGARCFDAVAGRLLAEGFARPAPVFG